MNLKDLRKLKRISQKQLAVQSGVTQSYICALEKGERNNPTIDVVKGLARGLGVDVSEVMDALDEAV